MAVKRTSNKRKALVPIKVTLSNLSIKSPEVRPLLIDKISMVWRIRPEFHDIVKSYICNIRTADKELLGETSTSWANKRGYDFAFNYRLTHLPVNKTYDPNVGNLLVQVDPIISSNGFLRFEFTPGALPNESVMKANKFFQDLVDCLNFHGEYPDIAKDIFFTRLELAVDIDMVSMEDLMFFKPACLLWDSYPECQIKGKNYVRGLYLGSKYSNYQLCVYDKKHQMKQSGKGELIHERTRIEGRVRARFPLSEILSIKNPFTSLKVLDARLVEEGNKTDEYYSFFLDSVNRRGLQGALQLVRDKRRRKKLRDILLEKARVGWWKPDEIFQGLGLAVEKAGLNFIDFD